jgi:hypothetical protein
VRRRISDEGQNKIMQSNGMKKDAHCTLHIAVIETCAGKGCPISDEGTDTMVFYVSYNPSTVGKNITKPNKEKF